MLLLPVYPCLLLVWQSNFGKPILNKLVCKFDRMGSMFSLLSKNVVDIVYIFMYILIFFYIYIAAD